MDGLVFGEILSFISVNRTRHLNAGFMERVKPLLAQGRQQGYALSSEEIRRRCVEALQGNSFLSAADVGPLLSQLGSCLEEVRNLHRNSNRAIAV
jgi:hypothetical protein